MGMDVDAVGQSAYDDCIGKQLFQFFHETETKPFAVLSGMACAYQTDEMQAVEVGIASVEQDERGIMHSRNREG